MRYVVAIGDERYHVDVGPDGATMTAAGSGGPAECATLEPDDGSGIRVMRLGDRIARVVVLARAGRGEFTIEVNGARASVLALDERTAAIRELAARVAPPPGPAPLVAPMPGLVVRVHVAPGESVRAGTPLLVMEAMKMENELRAASDGVVRSVRVAPGAAVEKGAVLIELE